MKIAISFSDTVIESVERISKRLGICRSQLYQRAIESYVRRHDQRDITEALDAAYDAEPKMSILEPVLEHLQRDSISTNDW